MGLGPEMVAATAESYSGLVRNGRRYDGKLLGPGPKWLPLQRKATQSRPEMVAATAESYSVPVRNGRRYSGKHFRPSDHRFPLPSDLIRPGRT